MTDDLITIDELAAWLRVPRATIYTWRYKGDGPPGFRVGRHVRFRRKDVEAWIEGQIDVESNDRRRAW